MHEIVIGCDFVGYQLTQQLCELLEELKFPYQHVGVHSADDKTVYPDIARLVAESIIHSDYSKRGIIVCGTGIGTAVAANKFSGIYATICHDSYSAERAKIANRVNIITLGALIVGRELAKKVVKTWLLNEEGKGIPQHLEKLYELDAKNLKH